MAGFVKENVQPGSTLYTDESSAYSEMWLDYKHRTVTHWNHEYVRGNVHTNTIEGFWGNFKTGFRGAYKHCGDQYLQTYVNEYAFRYNRRKSQAPMFHHFCAQIKQLSWWVPYRER